MTLTHYIGGKITGDTADFDVLSTNYPNLTTFINFETFTEFILVSGVWEQVGQAPLNLSELKAYYKFDNDPTAGDLVNQAQAVGSVDSISPPTDADGQNTSVVTGGGKIGDAYSYNGTTSFTKLGTSLSQFNFLHNTTAKFTLNFWYKLDALNALEGYFINNIDNGSTGDQGFGFSKFSDVGGRQCRILMGNNGTFTSYFTSTTFLPADTASFHMLTVRYNEALASGNLLMRVDNGTDESINKAGTRTNGNATTATAIGQLSNLVNAAVYAGDLDEFSIWDRVLTDDEITRLYNSGNGLEL